MSSVGLNVCWGLCDSSPSKLPSFFSVPTRQTLYVQRYIVVRSRNRCCHGNATIRSLLIVIVVDVAVNTIKVFSVAVAMEMHHCRAVKYFVLLLAVISIKHYECVCGGRGARWHSA